MTEQELASRGVHRLPLPIPFVAAGGPVNAYLIEAAGGGLVLFDAGLGSDEAQAALADGFSRLGFRFGDLRRIVVSHGHVDHYGAAAWVQQQHGGTLPVSVHPADLDKISDPVSRLRDRRHHYAAHFSRLGVPAEVIATMAASNEIYTRLARPVADVQPLRVGEVIEGRDLRFEVVHMPGHTPGLCCLLDRAARVLLPADHLLEKVSPNPIIELDAEGRQVHRPLTTYLASIERTRALDVDLVMPGHGPGFSGHRELIDGLLGFYEKRQARLHALLSERPLTGWELCRTIFPRAHLTDPFLTLSETVANLEVLEDRGRVVRVEEAGAWKFEPALARA